MIRSCALVSVIVPVYGTEKYLPACIESICNQSYKNLQIILVDDQSPDKCPEICDDYAQKDERIIVIHQQNKGVSGARNTGIKNAAGKFIMFVDSDDELYPNAVEILLQDALNYNADIASASTSLVTIDGNISCEYNDNQIYIYEGIEMIKQSLNYGRTIRSLHSKLFTKNIIKDMIFIEGHNINEDGYFMFQCYAKQPKNVQHNISLYKYFYRENSASRDKFSEKYFDMLYFCDLKMQYISRNMPHLIEEAKNMMVRTNILFLEVLCRTTDKQYRMYQNQSVKIVRQLFKYHKPINKHHKKLAWIVKIGLYPVYKVAVRFKYYR